MSGYLKLAVKNLLRHRIRSALTMLGIIIGVAAVIAVLAVGAGAQQIVIDELRNIGAVDDTVVGRDGEGTALVGIRGNRQDRGQARSPRGLHEDLRPGEKQAHRPGAGPEVLLEAAALVPDTPV